MRRQGTTWGTDPGLGESQVGSRWGGSCSSLPPAAAGLLGCRKQPTQHLPSSPPPGGLCEPQQALLHVPQVCRVAPQGSAAGTGVQVHRCTCTGAQGGTTTRHQCTQWDQCTMQLAHVPHGAAIVACPPFPVTCAYSNPGSPLAPLHTTMSAAWLAGVRCAR